MKHIMAPQCPNCGETVAEKFCSHCGQRLADRRRTVSSLLSEAFSEILALDGRHLTTMRGLLVPGKLTAEYLAGRRARYVTPVRIYLAMSLLLFLFVSLPTPDANTVDVFVDGEVVGDREPSPDRGNFQFSSVDSSSVLAETLQEWFGSPADRWKRMSAQQLLDGFVEGFERSLPRALILFVPFVALALKLLYIRKARLYYDHLIFSLHFQSFLFLALIVVSLLNMAGLSLIMPAHWAYLAGCALAAPTYLVVALKRVYGQGWVATLMKSTVLGFLYLLLTLVVFSVAMVMAFYRM